jgi:hypothetical protein
VRLLEKVKAGPARALMVAEVGKPPAEVKREKKMKLPETPFQLWPKLKALEPSLGRCFWLPMVRGEAVGLEWWHYEIPATKRGKPWLGLLEDIGWTREGLQRDNGPDVGGLPGLGYDGAVLDETDKKGRGKGRR